MQKVADMLVTGPDRSVYAAQLSHSPHWLSVVEGIKFIIIVTAFKYLHNMAPTYLPDFFSRIPVLFFTVIRQKPLSHITRSRSSRYSIGGFSSVFVQRSHAG